MIVYARSDVFRCVLLFLLLEWNQRLCHHRVSGSLTFSGDIMKKLLWMMVAGGFFFSQVSFAQVPTTGQGVISVNGSAEMTKTPEIIRLQIKQYGKGADAEGAKTALVAAEKKLMTKLSEAGAEVIVSNAGMALPAQNLHNTARNMIMQRRMAAGDNSVQPEKNPSYLERYLTIDLKPKTKAKETMVLLADLQERIRKDYQELSGMAEALPKDDSNDNNVRMTLDSYRSNISSYGNDVRFQMAAKITREDRVKLYAEAMRRAKGIAQDLAEAAEMKVGSIQTISSSFSSTYSSYSYSGVQRVITPTGDYAKFPFALKEDGSETIAVREMTANYQSSYMEPLTFQVNLSASFKLEPGK